MIFQLSIIIIKLKWWYFNLIRGKKSSPSTCETKMIDQICSCYPSSRNWTLIKDYLVGFVWSRKMSMIDLVTWRHPSLTTLYISLSKSKGRSIWRILSLNLSILLGIKSRMKLVEVTGYHCKPPSKEGLARAKKSRI